MEKNTETVKDTDVTFADGTHRRLSDLWKTQPLVLVFLRHLG